MKNPLLWVGLTGVVSCQLLLLTGGNLGPLAVATRFGIQGWFPFVFPAIYWASIALAVSGLILWGVRRLSRTRKDKLETNG